MVSGYLPCSQRGIPPAPLIVTWLAATTVDQSSLSVEPEQLAYDKTAVRVSLGRIRSDRRWLVSCVQAGARHVREDMERQLSSVGAQPAAGDFEYALASHDFGPQLARRNRIRNAGVGRYHPFRSCAAITRRLAGSSLAFLDIMLTGSAVRYFKANWQYGLFFLFPFVLLLVFLVVAVVVAITVATSLLSSYALQVASFVTLTAAIFIALLRWPGSDGAYSTGWKTGFFSWDYLYGRRPDVEARVDRFAEALVARSRDAAVDRDRSRRTQQGSTLAVEVVARALEIDPNLGVMAPRCAC